MKKVGILGSGIVGQTLGSGFIQHGYEVMLGTSNPGKLADWKAANSENARVGSFEDTVDFSNLLVLAVKGNVAKGVIDKLGNASLAGKTVIDATNPIADAPPEDGVLKFTSDINYSSMESLQDTAPDAHFVKGFNSISSLRMVNPKYQLKPSMFICGNNNEAKREVTEIMHLFGFEVEDMGTVKAARAIEPLCMLYCIPGFTENRWTHAFKVMTSPE